MDKRKELIEILKGDKTYLPTFDTIEKILILFDSSLQLKEKKAMTWGEWKKEFTVKEVNDRFLHINGNWYNYADLSWKYQSYKLNL